MLDEGILKRNALRWLAGKEYDDTKKKPHKELLFYWSIQELECVVQGNGPSVVIIASIGVFDIPSVFAVEGDVLLENNIAEYVPELQVFASSNIEEVGCIIGGAAEVSVSTDSVVSNVQSEGARFSSIEGAESDSA